MSPDTSADPKQSASEAKWGTLAMQLGFCIVPSLLLRAQARLGLNAGQLTVVMHLAEMWWHAGRNPFPAKRLLAQRMRLSSRQVQRYLEQLETAGLVRRVPRRSSRRGKLSNGFDLAGLVDRLNALAPEFIAVEQENRDRRRAVARPGARRQAVTTPSG